MKISRNSNIAKASGNRVLEDTGSRKPIDFSKVLSGIEHANAYDALTDMVSEIEKQGERLAQNFNINELKHYKKMIAEFLQIALGSALAFEKERYIDKRGRTRKYALVKTINEKVDDLMRAIIRQESSNIEVLKMIDDIRGLLLDLIM